MTPSSINRCGFTWPEDHAIDDRPRQQSCCFRETLPDADRCAWHARSGDTDEKTVEALQTARAPTDTRSKTRPVGELLDGAQLAGLRLKDSISFERTALRGADISGTDLSGANLRDADLSDADLRDADLSGATLRYADLSGATLRYADLSDADLLYADLSGAMLLHADLSGADIGNADLSGAYLLHADLSGAYLGNADLSGEFLEEADLSGAILEEADLSAATLEGGNLSDAGLVHADLSDANLWGVNLSDANLLKADLSDANLQDASLIRARLEHAVLVRTNLFDADLTECTPHGATFTDVQINDGTEFRSEAATPERAAGVLHRFTKVLYGVPVAARPFVPPPRCGYDPAVATVEDHEDWRDEDTQGLVGKAADTYQSFEKLARENARPSLQSSMFVLRQDMQRQRHWHNGSYFAWGFARLSRAVFKYGESLARIFVWGLLLIAAYTVVYARFGFVVTNTNEVPVDAMVDAFYFSTLTFTTLGLGDFKPDPGSEIARLLVTSQAALGAILIAVFVFVLGRRAAK